MKRLVLLTICAGFIFCSCGKKGDAGSDTKSPSKPVLILPAQNSVCVSGNGQSGSQSSIFFSWNAATNTDEYEITIKNLQTGTALSQTVAVNQVSVELPVNTPYSWQVISKLKNTSGTAQSDTWKFYSSGPGVVSYAPFPATAYQPVDGGQLQAVNSLISLSWTGSDADNDIMDYDIYFGTNAASPSLLQSHISSTSLSNIQVKPAGIYYWKIVTRDKQNNLSTSDIFQFRVK
ncbi:hypothetical protein [Mucilaginibacter rubeus]|uniref:hypothetical protein n=1 Tax=Mucilaginibacter rubeus TaxID=2027860 RepID=UPI00166DA255|nr:hypothetical protein [Mucilaginibacter rubeus]